MKTFIDLLVRAIIKDGPNFGEDFGETYEEDFLKYKYLW